MSQFFGHLEERLLDPYANDGTGLWQLIAPFQYYSSQLKRTIEVPAGFTYDHASVPRVPFLYDNFGNRYHRPSVVHDYLCRQRLCSRARADKVFLEAMRLQNAEEIAELEVSGAHQDTVSERAAALEGRAQAMYAAVVMYSKLGKWRRDVDDPGFEPIA